MLCNRVSEIKTLPFEDEEVDDPAYNALIKAGEKVVPCLIDEVGDTTSMRDPRPEPGYMGYDNKVGDVALWVLVEITRFDFLQFLPRRVQDDVNGKVGMLAYWEYLQNEQHRKNLQKRLYEWYRQKYGKDAREPTPK
jgi:hypothetical protein